MLVKRPTSVKNMILTALFIEEMATNIFLPALSRIGKDLFVQAESVNLLLSSYLLGLAISRPIYGLLADSYGRRITILWGLAIFVFGSLMTSLLPFFSWLVFFRFIQGCGGGVAIVIGFAVLCDMFDEKERARIVSSLNMIIVMAPVIAPIIGGEIIVLTGSWIYVFLSDLRFECDGFYIGACLYGGNSP